MVLRHSPCGLWPLIIRSYSLLNPLILFLPWPSHFLPIRTPQWPTLSVAHKTRTLSPSKNPSLTQLCQFPLATENFRQNIQQSLSKLKLFLDQLQQASTWFGHHIMSLLPLGYQLFIYAFFKSLSFIFSARYEIYSFSKVCYIKLRQQRQIPSNDPLLI